MYKLSSANPIISNGPTVGGRNMVHARILSYPSTNKNYEYFPTHTKHNKILSFHGGDYEEWRLLGYYAIWAL
jgi:hypothetical protein